MRLVTAMILAPTVSAAGACPTASDLKSGVRLEFSTGFYSVHTLDEAETVKVDEYDVDGNLYQTKSFLRHVLESSIVAYDEVTKEASYSVDFSYRFEMPLNIELGSQARGIQLEKSTHGEFKSEYEISFPSQARIEIGKCEYTYLEVKKQYVWPDDADEETAIYLIDLGLLVEIDPIPYNIKILQNGNVSRI